MTGLNREQKKAYAKKLFMTEQGITQKEIAHRVGATEATISKWVKAEDWEKERELRSLSKEEQMAWTHNQLAALRKEINARDDGKGVASIKELKEILKLTAELNKLETDITVAIKVEVMKQFLVWLRAADPELAMRFLPLSDAFIKDSI